MGSKSYEARAKKFDTKVPGATPFQSKLKEYELMAQTVGMFGEISKDGEPILEIAAWKRADEYCTFFAFKPQVALSKKANCCTTASTKYDSSSATLFYSLSSLLFPFVSQRKSP